VNDTSASWEAFHCRTCRRLLFKFNDGQKHRMADILKMRDLMDRALADGRISTDERRQFETTVKHERVIQIKCPLTACKTMNYLVESVR
jgi:hypothetical protein